MTALSRLLRYPHQAVFDVSPDSIPAFTIMHANGVQWSVADEVLIVKDGADEHTYDLTTMTVGQLAAELSAAGLSVSPISPEFAGLSASVLVEVDGAAPADTETPLTGFRSLLWSLFGGYARELRAASYQIGQALRQMVITQSEGEWLDLWGNLYNRPRKQNETDAELAPEIPEEAFRLRVNARAIEKAVLDLTGKRVYIEEPFGQMFRLDESKLSGTSRLYDGEYVGYHIIRPVAYTSIDWTGVLDIVNRNRGAGIVVLPPEVRQSGLINATVDGTCSFLLTPVYGQLVKSNTEGRLDYLRLSIDGYTRNYAVAITSDRVGTNSRYITWSEGDMGWCCGRTWLSTVFDDARPVSVSGHTYDASAITWLSPLSWGPFSWDGQFMDVKFVQSDLSSSVQVTTFDIDVLDIV